MTEQHITRRRFLRLTAAGAAGWTAFSRPGSALPAPLPIPVGYSIISWPAADFEHAFQTISALGYRGVQLLPWVQDAYPPGKTAPLKDQLHKLKLFPAALSCRGVSLRPDSSDLFADKFHEDADFLASLRGGVLQITDGGKPQVQYTAAGIKAMGARMSELGKMAKDIGLTLGYHPHFGTLGETREGLGSVLDATDPRYVHLIADVAHMALGGSDPAEVIRTYHQRLVMLHLKDLRRDTYEWARQNRGAVRHGRKYFCEIGTGVVNFPAITAALRQVEFKGWGIVELDAFVPPPGGPDESARMNKVALEKLGFKIG